MTFTPKTWLNAPNASTPLSAAALIDLETRIANETALKADKANLPINVKNAPYNAVGDGVTDDTAAIQAAIDALPANGGTLLLPPGDYVFASSLNLDDKRGVVIQGSGANNSGTTPGTRLKFTGTGTGRAVSARSSFGLALRDISLSYSSASFTGTLLDLSHSAAALDSQLILCEGVEFAGTSGARTATLLNLDRAINGVFVGCNFKDGNVAVKGRAGSGALQYSNCHRFVGCRFAGQTTSHASNPGEAWTFLGSTFQQLASGAPGALICDAGVLAQGVVIDGCWFGDLTATGTQIVFTGRGLVMTGCSVGVHGTAVQALGGSGDSDIAIIGNRFTGTVAGCTLLALGTGPPRATVLSNYMDANVPNVTSGTVGSGSMIQASGQVTVTGTIRATNANSDTFTMLGTASTFTARSYTAASSAFLATAQSGDAQDRMRMRADGTLEIGDGAAARDVLLARQSADVWGSTVDTIVGKSLRTEHVAAATPTGGASGDIKVGNSKIWVNDAGTWKSVAVA